MLKTSNELQSIKEDITKSKLGVVHLKDHIV